MHKYCALVLFGSSGLALGCMPSSDLDAHARGGEPAAMAPGASPAAQVVPEAAPVLDTGAASHPVAPGAGSETATSTDEGVVPVALDVKPGEAAASPPGASTAGAAEAGADAGASGPSVTPSLPPAEPPSLVEAPALPDDLRDAPVAGEITFSDEAEWEVDGVFEPTFEIHTPTASYWVVKPLGSIVSMMDREASPAQWIDFSSGFRPLRGVPSFATPPATRVTTVRDDESQTPTHLRLTAASEDGLWQWVWDFYVTHATFTVNRAPLPFGFAYQGVPGGSLGSEDRLVSNEGVAQGARSSFNADLAGPVEWAYLADTTLGRSVFAIQHQDDTLPERYQVRDNDTSLLSFGNGQLDTLPSRFSLGLIPSVQHDEVSRRVEFIIGAIH
jgi:hypothetical protein